MTAVVLAAGASRRMGSPKALLAYQGETFLSRMVRLMRCCCDHVVVVLAPGNEAWAPEGTIVAINPDPDRGMLSSLQCGLAETHADSVLFTPVDYPAIRESTIREVASAPSARPIVIPKFDGRRGHPVRISSEIVQDLLALPVETGTPADVIRRDATRIHYVEVDDPGIHRDIDLPSEYQELLLQC